MGCEGRDQRFLQFRLRGRVEERLTPLTASALLEICTVVFLEMSTIAVVAGLKHNAPKCGLQRFGFLRGVGSP